jgi:hypothetical protein
VEPSDAFEVTYPCWVLVHESSVVDTEGGMARFADAVLFVAIVSDADERSLPVFTDQDAAERFLDASDGMEEAVMVSADNRETLIDLLELVKVAADSVVFDPPRAVGWSRRVWPAAYVIRQLQNGQGLR